ncbi:MAG: hypothetical protein EOO24_22665 [Comamonadaceae bacterium]|nr:MAG: hypothetical protein EOO24_22665 [Comamonadaceae bacterium]
MSFTRIAMAAAIGACTAASAQAAAWRPVPGAPDIEMALGSLQVERAQVVVWLRWPGRHPLVPELASQAARGARVSRTALHTEFDCSRRTMRILAATAYDAAGTALFMDSTPRPARPVEGADLGWTYDAACEAARAERL